MEKIGAIGTEASKTSKEFTLLSNPSKKGQEEGQKVAYCNSVFEGQTTNTSTEASAFQA